MDSFFLKKEWKSIDGANVEEIQRGVYTLPVQSRRKKSIAQVRDERQSTSIPFVVEMKEENDGGVFRTTVIDLPEAAPPLSDFISSRSGDGWT
jgi:hypothetical protein